MGPDEREALFERARDLSAQQRTWSDADAVWGKVIDAYRAAVRDARKPDRNDERQLARALWRRSMLLSMMGRAADGLAPGRQAVTLFEQLNEAVAQEERDVTAPRRDEALAELITAMVDLGEVAFATGDADARIALVDQALGVGPRTVQPPAAGRRRRPATTTTQPRCCTGIWSGAGVPRKRRSPGRGRSSCARSCSTRGARSACGSWATPTRSTRSVSR
ncbi:hypothetical protein [Streptomyces sp. NPDC002845]